MKTVLVTGPSGFLGYHVVKVLNARGVRPRALLRLPPGADVPPAVAALRKLDVEEVDGDPADPASLRAACAGADTVFHLHFVIRLGGGPQADADLTAANVVGARNVLDAAEAAGVARVVVSSSSLAVGIARRAEPIDESADWAANAVDLPYARSRRDAEQEALARPGGPGRPTVVAVNPSFTMGPEDYQGAPANKLAAAMSRPRFRLTARIGFSVLDVRDYADGAVRAAERGVHGRRYLLAGENVMPADLLREARLAAGAKPPGFLFPLRRWMLAPPIAVYEAVCRLRGKPPKVTRSLLQIFGRYAWYSTARARADLGWEPRPLRDTVRDSLAWLAAQPPAPPR